LWEKRKAYWISVRKLEAKAPLGSPSHRGLNTIRTKLREREREGEGGRAREREDGVVRAGLIWLMIGTSQGLFLNTVMNLRFP
jgi:hypothetical protein